MMLFVSTTAWAQAPAGDDAEPPRFSAAAPTKRESWRQDVLVMMLGGGMRVRRIDFDVNDGVGATRRLDTGPYFDFGWHLLLRPMGHRSPRAALRAIVLQVDGGAGIGLEVEPEGSGISLNTNSWRMVGQVGFLYPIGKLQVGGLAGVGGDVFQIDLNSVLPSSRIIFARLGPSVGADVVRRLFSIRADFGVRFPFRYGELANAFGRDTRGIGLDGMLSFGGRVDAGFCYGIRFVWEYYRLRFGGPTDTVPAQGSGGGDGSDHGLTLQLLVGWSL